MNDTLTPGLSESLRKKLTMSAENESTSGVPMLPLDKNIPPQVLSRRRHAISSAQDSPFKSKPRMKRRGAISYEKNDSTAEYIRYLGDAMSKRTHYHHPRLELPELPSTSKFHLSVSRKYKRRGSMQDLSPSSYYKDTMKGTVLHSVNVEMQANIIKDNLSNIDNWDFDIFALRRVTEGRPLFHIGCHLLHAHDLINIMNLDIMKVMKFLGLVEQAYHPDNCYHNCTHAADVTQALHCLISEPKFLAHLTPLEILASLLAAICHDLDHPGVNQSYLLNTSSHLAFIHGCNSMLERHHCREARAILRQTRLLEHLKSSDREEIISLMETLILATDVTRHKDFMVEFEEKISSDEGISLAKKEERKSMLVMAIKAADISNPSRTLHLSKCWSESIMEEFFRQGDSERSMNLPISALCDRNTTIISKSQSGFFEYMALPLFKAWSRYFDSSLSVYMCKNIRKNKAYWDNELSKLQKEESDDSS